MPTPCRDPCRWGAKAHRQECLPLPVGLRSCRECLSQVGRARVQDQKVEDRLSQHPLPSHLPEVRGQFRHARPDALAIPEVDMDKLLLTPTEAATALGIGRSKVYELMQTGQLQSVHIGACRRVPAEALHAFLEQLRTAS